jgi:ParB family chromosome partitioning protein
MEKTVIQKSEAKFQQIPIQLVRSPKQPSREVYEDIHVLAETIKEHGLLQPLLVRKLKDAYGFEVVAGERRLRAAREAGLTTVPCIVLDGVSDEQALMMALTENIQRANLKPFEEIRLVQTLRERFNLSHKEIAVKIGVSESTVADYLVIAKGLPEKYRRMISHGSHSPRDLTITKALMLARADLPPHKLEEMIQLIRRAGLTRSQLAKKLAEGEKRSSKIKRVVASRTYWKELTKDLKEYARYWRDYCELKEWEDVSSFHLTLKVTMPKDLT